MKSFLEFKKKDMSKEIANRKSQIANLILVLIFLTWRAVDNWILFIAGKIVPYLGFFPYPRELFDFGLDHVFSALANFDGIHYLLIAHRGAYEQWEQAYFPLYPLMIKLFNFIFKNELITGLVISNIAFFIGLWVLIKYLKLISTKFNYFQLILTILVFPTSFFFGAVYTEGLFFLFFVLTLYFLKKQKYYLACLFSILASLTRLIGVFLVIPIILSQISNLKSQIYISNLKSKIHYLLSSISPFVGLGIYCFYLWKTTGDPFMFLTSQPVFGANRSTNIILLPQVVWRYLKIFFTASHNFQYYVSIFEFIIFFLVYFVLIFDLYHILLSFRRRPESRLKLIRLLPTSAVMTSQWDRFGLNLFSFANLILPTLTGTFSSIPRYALFSISFFIFLSEIKNQWFKIGILVLFIVFHVIILSLFGQGYFIG